MIDGNYAGVDWASEKHDVRVADAAGRELLAVTFAIWQGRTSTVAAHPVPIADAGSATAGVTQVSSDRRQLLIASGIGLAVMAGASLAGPGDRTASPPSPSI